MFCMSNDIEYNDAIVSNAAVDYLLFFLYFRCECRNCNTTYLDSALEYRCCKEVQPVLNLLSFEGRSDILCITKHPDFLAMTNTTVLKNVVPLFKNKQGKRYGRLDGRSENE